MAEKVKGKIELDKVTHSVRAAQAILQYGVGAMVDFPDQTLVTANPENWSGISRIFDDRFAKALGVDYFAMPTDITYARFPEWYFCPKCRKFQPLKKWISEYKKKASAAKLQHDENMVSNIQCPDCKQDLVVARIVTVCEKGHLNDFPWVKWVHARSRVPICGSPSLKFKTGASGSEGLEGLTIECFSCRARTTLKDAFNKDIFGEMDNNGEREDFICEGYHPFKHIKEPCGCYPRSVQRGASSVYFPLVYSSLVIPPYADKLNMKIEQSKAYEECVIIIEDEEPEDKLETIKKRFGKWASKIASEIGALQADVEKNLSKKWLENDDNIIEVTSVQYRINEYMALSGEISTSKGALGDFSRESMSISDYHLSHVKAVSLVNKVKVVNALTGFSRITPILDREDKGFVSIKREETNWYPAYEVRGEGIFIEFDSDDIEKWINEQPEVLRRAQKLSDNYANSFIGKNHPRNISPKFIMLHTLSHLLISQLSFECGYSIASLSERLYCSEEKDGKQMAGILIYTASGDSEGTLGGLVRQGRPDAFPRILRKAVNNAKTCSNDPVCIMSKGQGRDSLNLAACHACALLPETCCEERNAFLDRGLIIGTFEEPSIGFWSDL
ncbi:DUF1998 domain-containing protein [Anaerosporobacter sp.]|uniref:DUF1998 domain-containing protein n=1 Tax=Anaerosporobacter sp. TaxID=1872529 RepID=UPI00286EC570|nr:DUF1998 domain-containing protein [Anaerosporobacter sp.]